METALSMFFVPIYVMSMYCLKVIKYCLTIKYTVKILLLAIQTEIRQVDFLCVSVKG